MCILIGCCYYVWGSAQKQNQKNSHLATYKKKNNKKNYVWERDENLRERVQILKIETCI